MSSLDIELTAMKRQRPSKGIPRKDKPYIRRARRIAQNEITDTNRNVSRSQKAVVTKITQRNRNVTRRQRTVENTQSRSCKNETSSQILSNCNPISLTEEEERIATLFLQFYFDEEEGFVNNQDDDYD